LAATDIWTSTVPSALRTLASMVWTLPKDTANWLSSMSGTPLTW
jgi:hypothetical protein